MEQVRLVRDGGPGWVRITLDNGGKHAALALGVALRGHRDRVQGGAEDLDQERWHVDRDRYAAAAAVRRNRQDAADQVLLGDDATAVGLAAARAVGQLSEPERVRIEVPVLQDRISRTPRGNLVATMTVLEGACERCGVDRILDVAALRVEATNVDTQSREAHQHREHEGNEHNGLPCVIACESNPSHLCDVIERRASSAWREDLVVMSL